MTGVLHMLEELQQRGFGMAHLHVLRTLLATGRNGSWTVHVVSGRVTQIDTRLVTPSHPDEMVRLEALVTEACAAGTPDAAT